MFEDHDSNGVSQHWFSGHFDRYSSTPKKSEMGAEVVVLVCRGRFGQERSSLQVHRGKRWGPIWSPSFFGMQWGRAAAGMGAIGSLPGVFQRHRLLCDSDIARWSPSG